MAVRRLTFQDLMTFYSGAVSAPFLPLAEFVQLRKDVGSIETALGEWTYNRIYGPKVWAQLNLEANWFSILPKITWPRGGWRIIKEFSTTYDTTAISETGTLPSPTRPEFAIATTRPKVAVETFEVSEVLERLAELGVEDVFGSVDQLRTWYGLEFVKLVNRTIARKVIGTQDVTETEAGNKFESIDRIVSGYDEKDLTNDGTSNTGNVVAVDVYGLDRHSAPSNLDAYVNHNSGTLRDLTADIIRTSLANVRKRGGNTNVIVTGYDTYAKIQGIFENQARYLPGWGETTIQVGIQGVKTALGAGVGIKVASIYGIPLIQAVDTPDDGSGSIQRIYLLDTTDPEGNGVGRLNFAMAMPPSYVEGRNPLYLNKFVIKGAYVLMGDVVAYHLHGQGKIRDLQ